ncbi:putative phage protein [Staphylococcus aureus 1101-1 2010]|nr:putative phage protein [Staphylococcus aureus 1101-1 2010]
MISKSKEKLINKAHDEIQPFNHLDLNSMKKIVDDITFSYQIEQGLQAYKRELYLPAAATFAVAIETFLIKLKKVNKIKHKDTDSTMYTKLLGELTKEGKVNYRTKKRVEIAYSMRNIINHSQAGAVAKGDCDFLLNTLKDIVDENERILTEYSKSINKTE